MKKLFLLLGFLFTALRLCAVNPVPFTEGLSFSGILTGTSGTNGGGLALTVTGDPGGSTGFSTNGAESALALCWLRPSKQYTATINGTVVGTSTGTHGSYLLSFTAPDGYALYIGGVQQDLCNKSFSSGATQMQINDSYTIEIRPLANSAPAPAGRFSGIAIGKSVTWGIGLGQLRSGASAGQIFFKEADLTNSPASRARLYYTSPLNNFQISQLSDGTGLHQVITPQVCVDISDALSNDPTGGYTISFYAPPTPIAGVVPSFPTGTTAWRTIRVVSPGANQLTITEIEGSVKRVSALTLTSTGSVASGTYAWQLQEGDDTTWLRTTTHDSVNHGGNPATRDDLVTVRTGDTSGTIVSQTNYHYVNQGWNEEVVTDITTDPSGDALTTSYTYNGTPGAFGNYRKVMTVTDPTGNWTSYAYYDDWNRRGQLAVETHPFVSTPSTAQVAAIGVGDSVAYDYTSDFTGRSRIEKSRKNYTNYTSSVQTGQRLTDAWPAQSRSPVYFTRYRANDYDGVSSLPLQTTTEITDPTNSNPEYNNLPLSVMRADQSQDSYAYYLGTYAGTTFNVDSSGTYFRTNVWHGTTNPAGADIFTAYAQTTIATIYLVANQSTMDVTIQDPAGSIVRRETWIYIGGGSFSSIPATSEDLVYDFAGRLTSDIASNGATTTNNYTNGRLHSTVDASGAETDFTYDQLGRVQTSINKGVAVSGYTLPGDITTTYTYDGADRVGQTQVSGGALTLTNTATFDKSGRLTGQVQYYGSTNSVTTGYAYTSGGSIVTVTLPGPGGPTKVISNNPDGSLYSITGTGVVNEFTAYSIDSSGHRVSQHRFVSTTSPALTTTTNDWLGRNISIVQPGWNGGTLTKTCSYNSYGQLSKCSQTGLADTLYTYDNFGGLLRQGLDVNASGDLDFNSTDRIVERSWTFFTASGNWWRRDNSFTYAQANANATLVGKLETQISGLPANRLSNTNSYDIYNNVTTTYIDVDRTNQKVTSTTVAPDSTTNAVQIAYNGFPVSATDTAGVNMKYGYDALGRRNLSIDPRTGTTTGTTTTYIAGTNLVNSVSDPAGVAQATYTYDSAGRVSTVTNAPPFSKVARYEYTILGQKLHEWGDTTYPAEYVYDSYGRQMQLKTYASSAASLFTGSAWPTAGLSAPAFTFWDYETATGLLKNKYDAANLDATGAPISGATKVSYTYTTANQPLTRTNQRGVVTNYIVSPNTGELTGMTYSDGTPSVSYTYNRIGSMATVADTTGITTLNYNLSGTLELQSEDLPAGYFSASGNRRLTSTYAPSGVVGRPTGFQLGTPATPTADQSVIYGYQADGRLGTISGAGQTFTYGYTALSHLIGSVTNGNYKDARLYNSTHDWTQSRETTWGGTDSKAKFAYAPDAIGQTTSITKTGELFNRYGNGVDGLVTNYSYDSISQLKSEQTTVGTTSTILAGRNNGTPGAPGFAYDNLGNRTATTHNGATANYAPKLNSLSQSNGLNQYGSRDVTNIFDVAGGTAPGAGVTVNGSTVDAIQGEYFFKGQTMSNTTSLANYQTLTVSDGTLATANLGAIVGWSVSAVADFNGDGGADIFLTNTSTGDRVMWLMNGATQISSTYLGTVPLAWVVSGTGDFNGDGKRDILWSNTSTGDRSIWLMNGATQIGGSSLGNVPVNWVISGVGDFNGDGMADILLTNTSTGDRVMWLMNGTTIVTNAYVGTVAAPWVLSGVGDFNGDGKADILWSNASTGDRSMWLMNGPTQIGGAVIGNVPSPWVVSGVADFNADGKADILWSNTSTGDRAMWLMNGTTLVSNQYLSITPTTWVVSGTGDFNGDSKADILWTDTSSSQRNFWFLTGNTALVPAFVAPKTETFGYDADGNLTSDGRWNYTYDAENRLITQTTNTVATNAGVSQQKLTFAYDFLGRRVSKIVQSGWNGSAYTNVDLSRRYIYNGWNLIAELDGTSLAVVKSYYWGLDLSGTIQGAGGTGGLLLTKDGGNSYLSMYDGMGNLAGLITAGSATLSGTTYPAGSVVAAYEYDAFGNVLRESGPYAATNPFQFATKYKDIETGLVYYGLRYYSPSMGRFINNDPIEESGGLNLYGFCGNNGVNGYDLLGMVDPASGSPDEVIAFNGGHFKRSYVAEILAEQNYYNQGTMLPMTGFLGGYIDNSGIEEALLAQRAADYEWNYNIKHPSDGNNAPRKGDEKTTPPPKDANKLPAGYKAVSGGTEDGKNATVGILDASGNLIASYYLDSDSGLWVPNAPNTSLAGPSGTDGIPVGRGSDAVRAAALARYSSLPAAQKALLLKTFLDPANDIYSEHSGKASEYETAIGFYQKRDGTTYFEDSGVQSESHDVDDMFASVGIGSLDARRTLAWVVDFHSHSNDRSPGLSGPDSTAYNNGYGLIFGTDKVRLPMAYSGAFYAKQQVFYGWTRTENYTLTFGEMRNVLSH